MKAWWVGGIACVIASSCFAQAEPKLYMSADVGWTNAQPERGCSSCDYDAGVWRLTALRARVTRRNVSSRSSR